jgi:hypothetical protein
MPQDASTTTSEPVTRKTCGIVMPISGQPGCSAEHWADVRSIIEESVQLVGDPKFDVSLVSDADDVGVIQKRIVQNVYSADILICDVSCKNPNVMFELGMRLAFDKPTVIIKDDQTDYSFDTGIIEHLTYPRDLRFTKITLFKKLLSDKLVGTYRASQNPQHTTFLKNFGTFHVAALTESIASPDRISLDMLQEIQSELSRLRRDIRKPVVNINRVSGTRVSMPENAKMIAGRQAILDAIPSYLKSNHIKDVRELKNNIDFELWLIDQSEISQFFESKTELARAVEASIEIYDLVN